MPLNSFKIGRLTCHAIEGGTVRLDGGAMFGVVPKVLWQRRIPPDERNRIPLAMRCLLIEHPDGLVLVDTGLGNKAEAKFKDIYGVDNEGRGGRTRREDALETLGHEPADRSEEHTSELQSPVHLVARPTRASPSSPTRRSSDLSATEFHWRCGPSPSGPRGGWSSSTRAWATRRLRSRRPFTAWTGRAGEGARGWRTPSSRWGTRPP